MIGLLSYWWHFEHGMFYTQFNELRSNIKKLTNREMFTLLAELDFSRFVNTADTLLRIFFVCKEHGCTYNVCIILYNDDWDGLGSN